MRVGEHQHRDRLAHGARRHVEDAPEPALLHAGHRAVDQRHRRQHEVAVGGLPLLAAEAERVDVDRRAARVGDQDVERAEVGLDRVDQPGRGVEVGAVVDVGVRADLHGGGLDAVLASASSPPRPRPRRRAPRRCRARCPSRRRSRAPYGPSSPRSMEAPYPQRYCAHGMGVARLIRRTAPLIVVGLAGAAAPRRRAERMRQAQLTPPAYPPPVARAEPVVEPEPEAPELEPRPEPEPERRTRARAPEPDRARADRWSPDRARAGSPAWRHRAPALSEPLARRACRRLEERDGDQWTTCWRAGRAVAERWPSSQVLRPSARGESAPTPAVRSSASDDDHRARAAHR